MDDEEDREDEEFVSNHSVAVWSGTPQDIIQIAKAAAEVVGKWDPKTTCTFKINVEFGTSEAKGLSEASFEKLAALRLKEIDSITVHVGSDWYGRGARIAFSSSFGSAVRVSATGSDRLQAEAVRNHIRDHLRRGDGGRAGVGVHTRWCSWPPCGQGGLRTHYCQGRPGRSSPLQ